MDKLKLITNAFNVMDKQKSGMTDSNLDTQIPVYVFSLFGKYLDKYLTNVSVFETGKKINFGVMIDTSISEFNNGTIRTFKEVDYKEVRGMAKYMPGKIIKTDTIIFNDKKRLGITDVYGTIDGINFKPLSIDKVSNDYNAEKRSKELNFDKIISPMVWMDFAADYLDIIEIKNNKSTIKIPTHPDASKELLKLRDIPEGMRRRPALINWVAEHARECKNVETTVKRHLRGREEVNWMGYKVIVHKNT